MSAVCDLRLDFETFTTVGTGNTLETTGGVCTDTFVVTVSRVNSGLKVRTECWTRPRRFSQGKQCQQFAAQTPVNTVSVFERKRCGERQIFHPYAFSLRELGQPGDRLGHIGFHLLRHLNYQDVRHQGHPGRVQQHIEVKQTTSKVSFVGICRYIC